VKIDFDDSKELQLIFSCENSIGVSLYQCQVILEKTLKYLRINQILFGIW
jgi:hypothetical protein